MEREEYKKFREKLLKHFDKALVSISTHFGQAIFLNFINDFKVIIIPHENEHKDLVRERNIDIIFDKDFNFLRECLENKAELESIEKTDNFGLSTLFYLCKGFKKNISKEEALDVYKKTIDYPAKKLLSDTHNLKFDPSHEFFLFGNDELVPRYREYPQKSLFGNRNKIIVLDHGSCLFGEFGSRSIDLQTGMFYRDDQYIYIDKDIVKLVECNKIEATDIYVGSSGHGKNETKKYMKLVLKENVDLSKVKKLKYESAYQKVFYLNEKDGEYSLETEDGEKIRISHPDLLIYIL